MKKSMIISTIAMIVVVVVALSTATYAWFSASSGVTATTEVSAGAGDNNFQIRTYSGTAFQAWGDTAELIITDGAASNTASLTANLWSPTSEIKTGPTLASLTSVTTVATQEFYTGKADSLTTAVNGSVKTMKAATFQVMCTKAITGANEHQAEITVTVTPKTQEDVAYAAAFNTKIVIIETILGEPEATNNVYGTSYTICSNSSGTATKGELKTPTTAITNEGVTYNPVNPVSGMNKTGDSNTHYIEYTKINLTGFTVNSVRTYSVYVWIDGWGTASEASNGQADVSIMFAAKAST